VNYMTNISDNNEKLKKKLKEKPVDEMNARELLEYENSTKSEVNEKEE
jgi:hypothetical protein